MTADPVRRHYARGDLVSRLLAILEAQGRDTTRLHPEDLAGLEDMHVGGREATRSLAELLAPEPGEEVLDIGSGLGGAARWLALAHRCRVTGIDLTPELVDAARALSRLVGMGDHVRFAVADALDLPFPDASFDAAWTMHVGMNIADKLRFYREAARVLRPAGRLALYDLLRAGGEPDYPVPWADTPATSHLVHLEELIAWLQEAGLRVVALRDRTDFARAFMRASRERAMRADAERTASARAVMGEGFREKITNLAAALEDGRLCAYELLARKGGS